MKILLTGGSGLLGKEIQKYIDVVAPGHNEMDITKPETYIKDDFDIVIHAAAYTDLVSAEKEKKAECYIANVLATKWLAEFYKDAFFVYISSEYSVHPVNWYSWTKAWGEEMVSQFHNKDYLIIRTLFKPRPFEHPKACVDQWTQGDYVNVIAPKMIHEIEAQKHMIDQGITESTFLGRIRQPIILVGTGRKTTYELAKQTRPDIIPCLVEDIKTVNLPKDYII